MKKLRSFLLLLLLVTKGYSQEQEKLPEQPWKDILEMNSHEYSPITKWATDIDIKLEGLYTEADSLVVSQITKKLDSITETISITFTNTEDANLRIHFLDTLIREKNNFNSTITGRYGPNYGSGYESAEVYVYKSDNSDLEAQNTLESRLAKTIVNGSFINSGMKRRNSVFNPQVGYNNSTVPLNQEDMAIINEVYGKDYEKRLKIAEEQYKFVLRNIRNEEISQRKKSIWWVKNPISILILPTIILLLVFVFIIKKINQVLSSKIKHDWFRFGIISFIGLLFANVLIVLFTSVYDFITMPPYQYSSVSIIGKIKRSTIILFVLVFPFLFLLRYIELRITKSTRKILTKTSLIFLSTGFLPFIIISLLMYFTNNLTGNHSYYFLSQIFLLIMTFASIRAFISYFIFKERSLIVENEMQLSHLRELKTSAELKALQSQINPHFLYNALNSIASLAHKNADKTEKMALSLSDLFKYTINRKGKKDSTIGDEVEMVKNYLEVEQIRFDDRLNFTIEVDPALENTKIPMFLIQPLIENAVKHGISKLEKNGQITLRIQKSEAGITIIVEDNGPDFPEGLVSGHGLQTVFDLLRLTYKEKASISWKNTPTKQIKITIEN